jgi:hypothetical protein
MKSDSRGTPMKKLLLLGMALVLTATLAGCGGGSSEIIVSGPGFVGIRDSAPATAPLLVVDYTVPPSSVVLTANILSDVASDGDIEFDPVLNSFFVTMSPSVLFFGVDSFNANLPEFRTFLTFPLDGSTGQDAVPGTAVIVSASLSVFVDEVSFASVIPTFLDMVEYPVAGLAAADFNSVPLAFRTLDFFSSDQGNFVQIDITPFMQQAQTLALLDLQTRFLIDSVGIMSAARGPSREASRTVHAPPRASGIAELKRTPSAARPDQKSRHM